MAKVPRLKIEFLKDEFDQLRNGYLANYHLARRLLTETKQMFFSLHYSEINNVDVLSEMLHFIGANQRVEKLATLPIRGSSDILSRFSNPEVAERYLREHGLMHWAHEHEASSGVTG